MPTVPWITICRSFAELEEKYAEELGDLTFRGFNAWQIVKAPLFFYLVSKVSVATDTPTQRPFFSRLRSKIRSRVVLLNDLLYVLFSLKSRKRKDVLFYAFSVDKLAKNENGEYFNFIVDGWVCDKIVQSYFYAEQSINGEFRQPSAVPKNFNIDRLKNAALAYGVIFNGRKKYDVESRQIVELLRKVFKDEQLIQALDINTIKNIFQLFEAEYEVSRIFLKKRKPSLIISSEQPGGAFLAASINLGIPTLDLQHGLIDKFHPQYTYSRKMLPIRGKMILPNWVGVFGEFHKKILTENGFWSKNEIVVIGSKRVDVNRSRYNNVDAPDVSMTLLLPTQWTVYEEMKTVVSALIPNLKNGARIILKMHPLENPVHIAGYEDLVKSSGGKIVIAEKDADIFQLINECRLMIGFDSTVLLESITFGKPAVTIGLPTAPMGIHSLFSETTLEPSIKVVPIDNLKYLNELIERAFNDHQFYRNWKENAYLLGNELYARNYQSNCRQFIESTFANEMFEVNNN